MGIVLFSKQGNSEGNPGQKILNAQLCNSPHSVFCELTQCFEFQFLLENFRMMKRLKLNEYIPILHENN